MTTQAVAYLRFSPRRNSEMCESNQIQLDYIRAYCTRLGYALVETFADEDLSGGDEDRPGLWDAIHALRKGMVLVVYKADRLARSVYLSELIQREVGKRKAVIEVVEGSRNGESPEDVFIRQVFAAFAELERKVIAARTRAAMLRHQANGRSMSSVPPFGWKFGPVKRVKDGSGKTKRQQQLVPAENEQAAIKRMVQLREEGLGLREVARKLDEEGFQARGEKGFTHYVVKMVCEREGLPSEVAPLVETVENGAQEG